MKYSKAYRSVSTIAIGVSALLIGARANAQSATDASKDTSDEIVVTANKREQSLNDVGLTVAVLGREELADKKITSLADIAGTMPGLSYSASENNTPVFTLRGIGFNEAALAAYPTVSVYVDEAPLPFPVLASQGAFDLERIEVLKGPQGTLFGQNSTGGAINYIAAKPTSVLAMGGDLSYGRFNSVEVNGYVSGPLSDTLQARVAGHFIRSDDWQRSYTRDDTLGRTLSYAGRAIFDWTPTAGTKFSLTLNAWRDKSDPQAGQLVTIYPQVPGVSIPNVTNYPYPPKNPRAADWSFGQHVGPTGAVLDPTPQSNRRMLQSTLRGDFDLSPDISLTTLTSYVDFKQRQNQDYDAQATNDEDIFLNDGRIKSFFQEVRLANGAGGSLRWIVGANFQRSTIVESNAVSYSSSTASNPGFNNIVANGYRSNTLRKDKTVFGNVEYDIVSGLTIKAGARYTDNYTRAQICNYDVGDGRIAGFNSFLRRLITGNPNLPDVGIGPDQCITPTPQGDIGIYTDTLQEDNVSWKVGLDYKPARGLLLYTNVSRGYKAGSYPTISASSTTQYTPVTQEIVTSYEGGIKFSSRNNVFNVNAAAFYYDYKDKQVRGKFIDPVYGILTALVNVPKSRIYGFEVEGALRPVDGLRFSGSLAYVNSQVTRFTGLNAFGIAQDFRGASIPFTPEWQGQFSADYSWNATSSVQPFLGATVSARSSTASYLDGENLEVPNIPGASTAPGVKYPFYMRGYATLDLRVGADIGNHVRVMVWGKNVTNQYYWQNVIYAYDTGFRLAGRPATFGGTVSWKY